MMERYNLLQGTKKVFPQEIVYEIPNQGPIGIALAHIEKSEPHFHNETTEWYYVTHGKGIVYLNGKELKLQKHDFIKIYPTTVHYVESARGIELLVITHPPWKPEDHHLVKQP